MCIVIDTNTLSKVFKSSDRSHSDFKPVLEWIKNGSGKIVVGGSAFNNELFDKVQWFSKAFRLLKQVGKVVEIDSKKVDKQETWVRLQKKHRDFDDPHLVALIGMSGCKIICTGDSRSFPFIQDKSLYPKGKSPPAIYTKSRNIALLRDTNVADCCRPTVKLSKAMKVPFEF